MFKMILACKSVLYHVIAYIYHGEGSTDQTENILFCEPKFGVILFKEVFTFVSPKHHDQILNPLLVMMKHHRERVEL